MNDLFDFGNPFANDEQPSSKKRQRDEDENQADIERSSHDVSRTITYDNDEDFISSLLDDTPPKTQPSFASVNDATMNQSQVATTKAPVLWCFGKNLNEKTIHPQQTTCLQHTTTRQPHQANINSINNKWIQRCFYQIRLLKTRTCLHLYQQNLLYQPHQAVCSDQHCHPLSTQ